MFKIKPFFSLKTKQNKKNTDDDDDDDDKNNDNNSNNNSQIESVFCCCFKKTYAFLFSLCRSIIKLLEILK